MSAKSLLIKICTYTGVFILGCVFWQLVQPSPEYEANEPPPLYSSAPPNVPVQERVLYPTLNYDNPRVNERQLYGEYYQTIGNSSIWLSFSATEDFGPYTAVILYGEAGKETLRIGFYEVNEEGNVVLHLRFREAYGGETVPESATHTWSVSVNYPFIQLSDGRYTLLTTLYPNEERGFLWAEDATDDVEQDAEE